MDSGLIQQLLTALLLGILIGLERERSERGNDMNNGKHIEPAAHGKHAFAGIRTFALMSLLGAVSVLVSRDAPVVFWIVTAGFFVFITGVYVTNSLTSKSVGATTEVAALFAYFIGVLSANERFLTATVIALLVLMILHFKAPLHTLAEKVSTEEIRSTLKFMIIAFVILPLLPHEGYGPYEVLNPYLIWLMVVFISGISFISYIAIKLIGQRKGIGLTGFLGGFISSTALTLSFSQQSKENKNVVNPYVFAVVIASSAMFFRVLLEVSVIHPDLLGSLLIPMLAMGVTGVLSAVYIFSKKDEQKGTNKIAESAMELKSPFRLTPALTFGLLFAAILLITRYAEDFFGSQGVYITSFISGILDVDPITVSMANLSKSGSVTNAVAATAITIAAMTNTVAKGSLFFFLGNKKVAKRIAAVFAIMLASGIISLQITG
ncbi:MAG: MgtC/SapB family protein [Patescibacteria group bacterium]